MFSDRVWSLESLGLGSARGCSHTWRHFGVTSASWKPRTSALCAACVSTRTQEEPGLAGQGVFLSIIAERITREMRAAGRASLAETARPHSCGALAVGVSAEIALWRLGSAGDRVRRPSRRGELAHRGCSERLCFRQSWCRTVGLQGWLDGRLRPKAARQRSAFGVWSGQRSARFADTYGEGRAGVGRGLDGNLSAVSLCDPLADREA